MATESEYLPPAALRFVAPFFLSLISWINARIIAAAILIPPEQLSFFILQTPLLSSPSSLFTLLRISSAFLHIRCQSE